MVLESKEESPRELKNHFRMGVSIFNLVWYIEKKKTKPIFF